MCGSRRPRVFRILAERTIRLYPRIPYGHHKATTSAIVRDLIVVSTIAATACATSEGAAPLEAA